MKKISTSLSSSLALVGVVLLFAYLPFMVAPPASGLDPSWHAAIAYGLDNGFQFGRELVFTYGPLGALYARANWFGLFPYIFVFWAALILLAAYFSCEATKNQAVGYSVLAILPLILVFSIDGFVLYLSLCIALSAERIARSTKNSGLAVASMAVLSLCKFTFFPVGILVVASITAHTINVKRGWRRALPVAVYILIFFGAWIAAGQEVKNILSYLTNSASVASGYSDAMSVGGPFPELLLGVLLCSGAAYAAFEFERPSLWNVANGIAIRLLALLRISSVLAIVWVAFKAGYVRHDGHVFTLLSFSGATYLTIRFANTIPPALRRTDIAVVVLWVLLSASAYKHYSGNPPLGAVDAAIQHLKDQWNGGTRFVQGEVDGDAIVSAGLQAVKTASPLPPVDGGVDIASVDVARVLASGLKWTPRPVMQSYSVYTPKLAQLNQEFMASDARAPQNFFVDLATVDSRLPLQEDPGIWQELLTRYEVVRDAPIQLSRLDQARKISSKAVTLSEKNGYWIMPSPDSYDYAQLQLAVGGGLLRRIGSFVFRPSASFIEVVLENGDTKKFRYLTSLNDVPFVFSPFVESNTDFNALSCFCRAASGRKIKSFRLVDSKGHLLDVRGPPVVEIAKVDAQSRYQSGLQGLQDVSAMQYVSGIDDVKNNPILVYKGLFVRNAHAPAEFYYEPNKKAVQLCFGIRDGVPWGSSGVDGVRFVIEAADTHKVLESVQLDGRNLKDGEVRECRSVSMPEGVTRLLLRTDQNDTNQYDWAYWAIGDDK